MIIYGILTFFSNFVVKLYHDIFMLRYFQKEEKEAWLILECWYDRFDRAVRMWWRSNIL